METTQETTKSPIERVLRWDLQAIDIQQQDKIQLALEEGYEPFSVTPMMKKMDPKITMLNPNAAPQMVMETMLWLKRGQWVEIQ
jgi:hypothetical protein